MKPYEAGEETVVIGKYVIYYRSGETWFRSWEGKLFRLDDEEKAKAMVIEAHQALDRGYRFREAGESRLTLKTRTVTERVAVVPAMWEGGAS